MLETIYHMRRAWDFKGQIGRKRSNANGHPAKGNGRIKAPNIYEKHMMSGEY
jgi:hypothetical protein